MRSQVANSHGACWYARLWPQRGLSQVNMSACRPFWPPRLPAAQEQFACSDVFPTSERGALASRSCPAKSSKFGVDQMTRDPGVRDQRATARSIVLWGGAFGVVLLIVAAVAAFFLVPQKTNISDQPSVPATERTVGQSPATGGDNTGTSGNADRLGSGPAGSGRGSPTGSSSSVTGSTPSQSGTRGDAPGSATR
jgi:hypothetical protein